MVDVYQCTGQTWPSIFTIASTVLALWTVYRIGLAIRLYYMHPLSSFPGTPLAAITNLPFSWSYIRGRQPYDTLHLHEKYGSVVRVAPQELSFSSPSSWKHIYGTSSGHEIFAKSDFYAGGSFADQASSIVTERDQVKHRSMKKYLSPAFSDRSLKKQEYLISGVIDKFIQKIEERGKQGLDINVWFNLMTFDIIGELAFGKSFGGIESGKVHEWIQVVVSSMNQATVSDTLKRFPTLGRVFMAVRPGWLSSLIEGSKKHEAYTIQLISERIQQRTDRKDFMTNMLEGRVEHDISDIQLAAHASDFVIAGSETTATCLSAVTYYLLRNPSILSRLQNEIRSEFKEYEQINSQSTLNLRYLHATCLEALRMFPPLPLGLPRVVPQHGATIDGRFIPGGTIVHTNPLAASMWSENFKDPWIFKPERWLGKSVNDLLEASQPFSTGPRACLGRSLAWMELHTTLAKMHFKFDFQLINTRIDWHRDSRMQLLWNKPPLLIRIKPHES